MHQRSSELLNLYNIDKFNLVWRPTCTSGTPPNEVNGRKQEAILCYYPKVSWGKTVDKKKPLKLELLLVGQIEVI